MENKKKKSTLLRDALALFVITLISGLGLAYVNEVTKGPIEAQQIQKKKEAYSVIFTEAKDIVLEDEMTVAAAEADLTALDSSYGKIKINEVNLAKDENGVVIGYVIVVTTKDGYNPPISLAIGYDLNKQTTGLEYLTFNESKNVDQLKNEYRTQYIGVVAENFSFESTDGAVQVNAVSGATVSSKAIITAVNAGIDYLNTYVDGTEVAVK